MSFLIGLLLGFVGGSLLGWYLINTKPTLKNKLKDILRNMNSSL